MENYRVAPVSAHQDYERPFVTKFNLAEVNLRKMDIYTGRWRLSSPRIGLRNKFSSLFIAHHYWMMGWSI